MSIYGNIDLWSVQPIFQIPGRGNIRVHIDFTHTSSQTLTIALRDPVTGASAAVHEISAAAPSADTTFFNVVGPRQYQIVIYLAGHGMSPQGVVSVYGPAGSYMVSGGAHVPVPNVAPDAPDSPDSPDAPDSPDSPDSPGSPDTPGTPDTPPDAPDGDRPDSPGDTPDSPGDTPDSPGDTPDSPGDTPDSPGDTPDSPDGDKPDSPDGDKPDSPDGDKPDSPDGDKPDSPDGDKPDSPDGDEPDAPDGDKPDSSEVASDPTWANAALVATATVDPAVSERLADWIARLEHEGIGSSDFTATMSSVRKTIEGLVSMLGVRSPRGVSPLVGALSIAHSNLIIASPAAPSVSLRFIFATGGSGHNIHLHMSHSASLPLHSNVFALVPGGRLFVARSGASSTAFIVAELYV